MILEYLSLVVLHLDAMDIAITEIGIVVENPMYIYLQQTMSQLY